MTNTTNITVEKLEVGDIIAAKSTYGWEFLSYTFYKVVKTTTSMVTLTELQHETLYDDGKTGPHYYDDPYHVAPKMDKTGHWVEAEGSQWHPTTIRRKVTYTKQGLPKVKVDYDKVSYGVWEGKPLAAWNLH